MILHLILMLITLRQIGSASVIDQSTITKFANLQELGEEAATTTILTDYISTRFGVLKIHHSQATWNDARNICLDENAQLTVIDTNFKESMLLKFMKQSNINAAWIGVHDQFGKKQWTTIQGERLYTLGYVHWRIGEPNSSGAGEHCVELHHAGMNDLACENSRSFICEKKRLVINSIG